jgi:hypothetical protein
VKSVNELLEVKDAVIVLVKLSKESHCVVLQWFVAGGTSLYLCKNAVKRGLRENIWVILHIFLGILVSLHELELEATQEDGVSKKEISLIVVVVTNGICVLLALHELSANAAWVLVTNLVDLNSIVSAVERNNKAATLIIRLCGDEFWFKTQDVHVLLEHLFHVNLGRFWL